jgi:hypothetical protein
VSSGEDAALFFTTGTDRYFEEVLEPAQDRFAAIPPITDALIGRMVGAGPNIESSLCETVATEPRRSDHGQISV